MKLRIMLVLCLTLLISNGNVLATTFSGLNAGKNVTINDTIWNSNYNGGSPALGTGGEDNETEKTNGGTSTYTEQKWDLEGIFYNSATRKLTIIGGTNFTEGITFGSENLHVGDLFLGHFGLPAYAHGSHFFPTYALDFSRNSGDNLQDFGTYSVYGPGASGSLTSDITPLSDPYLYLPVGTPIVKDKTYRAGELEMVDGSPFYGWHGDNNHYYLQIDDWNYFFGSDSNILHLTLECGNDVLRGSAHAPEPSTVLLFGSGLVGLAGWRLRRK